MITLKLLDEKNEDLCELIWSDFQEKFLHGKKGGDYRKSIFSMLSIKSRNNKIHIHL